MPTDNTPSPNTGKKVMYVDDDPDDQHIFKTVLLDINPDLDCIVARDGLDALDKLSKMELPVCIYIDINMPKMNGIELAKQLRSNPIYKRIPTFIISTSFSIYDKQDLEKLGITFLTKPVSFHGFVDLLTECFNANH